jgi:hypothetical protein
MIIQIQIERSQGQASHGEHPEWNSLQFRSGVLNQVKHGRCSLVEVAADEVVGAQPSDAAAEPSINLDLKGIAEELEETFFRAEANDPDLLDNAWEAMVAPDGHGHPEDVGELLRCLEEAPDVRSAALMSALERARTELVRTPTHTLIDTPVQIPIADLIAMTRALMSRLR